MWEDDETARGDAATYGGDGSSAATVPRYVPTPRLVTTNTAGAVA